MVQSVIRTDRKGDGAFTRRAVLLATLGVGASLALSACGGAASSASATTQASAPPATTAVSVANATSAAVATSSAAATSKVATVASAATTAATTVQPSAGAKAAPGTVRFLERAGTNYQNYFKAAIVAFQKEQPAITIQAEWTDKYTDKLVTEVAGGTPPDLAFTSDDDLFSLAAKGLLLDIAPYFQRDKMNKDDYFDIALAPQFLKGKQWAMPLDLGVWVFFVNKDLFKKAGAPLPDGTWDFAKLQDIAQRLTLDDTGKSAPGIDPSKVVQAGFDGGQLRYGIDIPVGGNGGTVFNADASKCMLGEQPAITGLQWTADLSNKARCALGPGLKPAQKINFDAGNLALRIGGSWSIGAELEKKLSFDWDIAIPPKGPAKDLILAEASGISQIKTGKNPDGAWLFNKYMTGPEGQTLAFQYTVASVPSVKAVAAKVYQGVKQPASMPILADLAAKSSIPYWQRAVSDTELEDLFSKQLTPLWNGQQNAQDATTNVVKLVDEVLTKDQQFLATL